MAQLEYYVVDVFTDVAFTGNPLAVVLGAEALSTAQLQRLARQFQLSETAFVLAASAEEQARGVTYRLRIFTTSAELPFAGHPSVGSAWLLAQLGRVQPGRVVQACGAGELPLLLAAAGGPVELTGGRPTVSPPVDPGPYLTAVGLTGADLVAGAVPRLAGTGLSYGYLAVRPSALAAARADLTALHLVAAQAMGVYVVHWDTEIRTAQARMFADDVPGLEDPATGSAALGLGVWLVASGWLPADGTTSYTVHQGVEMGRPSLLECSVDAAQGEATAVRVSGRAVSVAHGWIEIPAP